MSRKVNWTRDAEVKLIQEVREKSILWDTSHPQSSRFDLRAILWEKVAEKLDPQITDIFAKERFENLRATFMRNEKKIKKSMLNSQGADNIYKPKWDLYPLLTFLKKTTAEANSVSNLDVDVDSAAASIHSEASDSAAVSIPSEASDSAAVSIHSEASDSSNITTDIASNIYFDENLQSWAMISNDVPTTVIETIPSETVYIQSKSTSFPEESKPNLLSLSNSVFTISQPSSQPSRPASAPANAQNTSTNTKRHCTTVNEDVYIKHGRKSSDSLSTVEETIMTIKKEAVTTIKEEEITAIKEGVNAINEEAVTAIKEDLLKEETIETDACDHLGAYVAARLRVMTPEQRAYSELEIVKILSKQI